MTPALVGQFDLHSNGDGEFVPALFVPVSHRAVGAYNNYGFISYAVDIPAGGHVYPRALLNGPPPPAKTVYIQSCEFAAVSSDGADRMYVKNVSGGPAAQVTESYDRLGLDWTTPAADVGTDLTADVDNKMIVSEAGGTFHVHLLVYVVLGNL